MRKILARKFTFLEMVDEEMNLGRRPLSLSMCEFTDKEKNNKESDVELESDSEAENNRLFAQYKVKPCSRRPIAGRPRSRSDGDASRRKSQFRKFREAK